MGFNYRVVKKTLTSGELVYEVNEVYYDECGKAISWSVNHNVAYGETPAELQEAFERVQLALKKPVLEVIGEDEGLQELSYSVESYMDARRNGKAIPL